MGRDRHFHVCATPGSGSELLRAALAGNGSVGVPSEHRTPAELEAAIAGFPSCVCIWVVRSNKDAQARSLLLDGASGDTDSLARELEAAEAAWADYFARSRMRPIVIAYEDDLGRDPEAAARRVLRELGIGPAAAVPREAIPASALAAA